MNSNDNKMIYFKMGFRDHFNQNDSPISFLIFSTELSAFENLALCLMLLKSKIVFKDC